MTKPSSPFISICILAFNRKDDVVNSLRHIEKHPYRDYEIIVVDNGSTDKTDEVILKDFPHVVYIKNRNEGISGWNKAFKKAKGKILLVLDDDSYPAPSALQKIANAFASNPDLDIITCNIIVYSTKKTIYPKLTTKDSKPQRVDNFTGGGVAMRKEACKQIGYFATWVFYGNHEVEFSLRALQKGYKIWFYPDIKVYHDSRPVGWRFYYYCTRNHLIIAWLYFPFIYAIPFTIFFLVESFVTSIKAHFLGAWLGGVISWIRNIGLIYKKRNPLPYITLTPYAVKFIYNKFNHYLRFSPLVYIIIS